LATVFGLSWRTRLDLLVNTICYEAYFNKYVELFEENFSRNYIGTPDIARLFSFCIDNFDNMKGETYNAGSDSLNCTKRELCDKVAKYISFTVAESNKSDPDKRDYHITSKKLYNKGFRPNYSLDHGIQDLISWFDNLPKDYFDRKAIIKYNVNTSI
jgi:nucleoside-diphosphate-sugar epimerase